MQAIQQLIEIMQALREPGSGCPWDLEQDFQSLIPYTLEEAYEVADAIERDNLADVKHELGDLLFQIIFYSQLANEQHAFDFNDVVTAINEKLTQRHPHVFGDEKISDAKQQTKAWEAIKKQERELKSVKDESQLSILDDVSRTLPSLMRAEKLQKRAAAEGFDWTNVSDVIDKVKEELDEVQQELEAKIKEKDKLENEMGDLFFSCINLSRHAGVDAEQCIRKANLKFESRFREMEKIADRKSCKINQMKSGELENLWREVKTREK